MAHTAPKTVTTTAILMAAITLVLPVFAGHHVRVFWINAFAAMVLFFVVLWFYWRGRNWARITILVLCAFRLIGLFTWKMRVDTLYETAAAALRVSIALLSLFLLYWLNTKKAVEYFDPTRIRETSA